MGYMKISSLKFDRSFLPLIIAFVLGLAASSSGCVETGSESISRIRSEGNVLQSEQLKNVSAERNIESANS